jgi:hypothetical protein
MIIENPSPIELQRRLHFSVNFGPFENIRVRERRKKKTLIENIIEV